MPKETAANAQTRIIERDLAVLSQRFDRHLEIYAQNGKELAGVKVSLDNLRTTIEQRNSNYETDQGNLRNDFKDYSTKLNSLELDVSKLATKVAMFATAGSAIASTIVSVAIRIFFY